MGVDAGLREFGAIVGAAEVDVARAALAIARIEFADLHPDEHLARLDTLAQRSRAGHVGGAAAKLERVCGLLFREEGFRGDVEDYYDPRNSCLNAVLDRRLGIPITLSLVTLEVGRRVGLEIEGIGVPGHFLVGVRLEAGVTLLDPFNGGVRVDRSAADDLASRALGRPVTVGDEHFVPVSGRQMVVRMLRNLQGAYARRGVWAKVLAVVERLSMVEGERPAHARDRGLALVRLGRLGAGAADLERYLRDAPDAPDAKKVRGDLRRVRQRLGERN